MKVTVHLANDLLSCLITCKEPNFPYCPPAPAEEKQRGSKASSCRKLIVKNVKQPKQLSYCFG
uniref:Uncharacterized protein n=1 Tax=Setaria italica TaxID=4555 RepID=K3YXI2_SETIT